MKFFMDSSKFVQGRQLAANASGCGSRRSKIGSLAQVPLPILFRTLPRPSLRCVFVHRNGDASPAAPLFRPRRTARPYKSLFLRQTESRLNPRLFYFCIKGVGCLISQTEIYLPKLSDFYIIQKRNKFGKYTK